MMDKDTGRPRGFGFVTFDGDAAVDACLSGPLQIHGKPIEVKRAQPRGNMREEEDNKKFGRGKFGSRDGGGSHNNAGFDGGQNNANQQSATNGMTPAMMAQYWQRMQQYIRHMQQSMAAAQGGQGNGMPVQMGNMPAGMPAGMNPAMMNMMGGMNQGGAMNPMMAAQFAQMQGGNGGGGGFGGDQGMMGANGARFNPQEQHSFEQQKYEQQQQRRMQQAGGYGGAGGPTAWEGMYDDAPQPAGIPQGPGAHRMHGASFGGHGKHNGRGRQGSSQPPAGAPNAPANAPTGPKNAGKPGANYRGGGRGGGTFRHNPYGGRG